MNQPSPPASSSSSSAAAKTARCGSPRPRRTGLWALVAVFAVWCIYVAIGSTGYYTDKGLYDGRKSLIVLGCSIIFMAFWCWVFLRPRHMNETAAGPERGINWCSLASFMAIGIAFLAWGGAWMIGAHDKSHRALTFSLISISTMGLSALLAIIGLSDPRPRKLKLLGLATLILLAFVAFALLVATFRGAAVS